MKTVENKALMRIYRKDLTLPIRLKTVLSQTLQKLLGGIFLHQMFYHKLLYRITFLQVFLRKQKEIQQSVTISI